MDLVTSVDLTRNLLKSVCVPVAFVAWGGYVVGGTAEGGDHATQLLGAETAW